MSKALITTVPFADKDKLPVELLKEAGVEYIINPLNKKLTEQELAEMVTDFEVIIAGTEPITDYVMSKAANLKMISRVGIGLDSVDLLAAEKRGIKVSYTPDAPSPAVAELTLGLMLTLLRSVHVSNSQMHQGQWYRYFGRRLTNISIGVIGLGRIGKKVLEMLRALGVSRLLVNDLLSDPLFDKTLNLERVSKETIYREADIITLHLPLTARTKNMVRREHLEMMKPDAIVINNSRGGIINEQDLYEVMQKGYLSGAAIDVFEVEPYAGKLREIERCLLTAHMGSMSIDCRSKMELEATEEAIRFLQGMPLMGEVPQAEYEVQRDAL